MRDKKRVFFTQCKENCFNKRVYKQQTNKQIRKG